MEAPLKAPVAAPLRKPLSTSTGKLLGKEHGKICRKAFHYRAQATAGQALTETTPLWVVLDTNAVLDWQLFEDPRITPLATAIHGGQVRWAQTQWMADELDHMLSHAWPARWKEKSAHLREMGVSRAAVRHELPRPGAAARLRCTDPDDQAFIDLALALPAKWLVTRDKAVLKLARRAAPRGVLILRPEDWPGAA